MAITKAQQDATTRYKNKVYDQIQFYVDKGKRNIIKDYATRNGLSQNQYINLAIDNQLKKDGFDPSEREPDKE